MTLIERATFLVAVIATTAAAAVAASAYSSPKGDDCVGREHSLYNAETTEPPGQEQSATVHYLQVAGTNYGQTQKEWRAGHCS
jgi:hypothetical protein